MNVMMVGPMCRCSWAADLMVKDYPGCFHEVVPFYWTLNKVALYRWASSTAHSGFWADRHCYWSSVLLLHAPWSKKKKKKFFFQQTALRLRLHGWLFLGCQQNALKLTVALLSVQLTSMTWLWIHQFSTIMWYNDMNSVCLSCFFFPLSLKTLAHTDGSSRVSASEIVMIVWRTGLHELLLFHSEQHQHMTWNSSAIIPDDSSGWVGPGWLVLQPVLMVIPICLYRERCASAGQAPGCWAPDGRLVWLDFSFAIWSQGHSSRVLSKWSSGAPERLGHWNPQVHQLQGFPETWDPN